MIRPMDADIAEQLARRDRFRLARWRTLSVEQRVAEMMRLQHQAAATLRSSPAGYDWWLRRNFAKRAVDVSPAWSDAHAP